MICRRDQLSIALYELLLARHQLLWDFGIEVGFEALDKELAALEWVLPTTYECPSTTPPKNSCRTPRE